MASPRALKARRAVITVAVLLVVSVAYYFIDRPRSILDSATLYPQVKPSKMMMTSGPMVGSLNPVPNPAPATSELHIEWLDYVWTSDQEIRAQIGSAIEQIDVQTGAVRALAVPSEKSETVAVRKMSPDGRWALAEFSRSITGKLAFRRSVVELDGKRQIAVDPWLEDFMWSSDSKAWLRHTTFGIPTGTGTLDGPREQVIRTSGSARWLFWYSGGRAVGPLKEDEGATNFGNWAEFDVKTGKSNSLPIQIPIDANVAAATLSPDGQLVLWEVGIRPSRLDEMLSAIGVRQKSGYFDSTALYTSRPDGTDMRLLGAIREKQSLMARWMPDCRHISFISGGRFYSIPIQ